MNAIEKVGDESLLSRHKIAFLCSRLTPEAQRGIILEWADRLSPEGKCVLCGSHSYMEQEVFKRLLQQKVPVVWMLVGALPAPEEEEIVCALRENRLLMMTFSPEATRETAFERNKQMLAWADEVVVGFVTPGGQVEQQIAGIEQIQFLVPLEVSKQVGMPPYKLSSKRGDLYFDMMDLPTVSFLKVTRERNPWVQSSVRESIRIDKADLLSFRYAIDRARLGVEVEFYPVYDGASQSQFIRVFQVIADRNAFGDGAYRQVFSVAQPFKNVISCRVAFRGGAEGKNDFPDAAVFFYPLNQRGDVQVCGTNAVHGGNDASQYVV